MINEIEFHMIGFRGIVNLIFEQQKKNNSEYVQLKNHKLCEEK